MSVLSSGHEGLGAIAYDRIIQDASDLSEENLVAFLMKELYFAWCESYEVMSSRPVEIVRIPMRSFYYLFDCYPLYMGDSTDPYELQPKARVVVAYGQSSPKDAPRDDYRLKRWLGPTEKIFGKGWDKGHFIAHSIGANVDRNEMNVFPQRRFLNRGWSASGKLFRQMEKECSSRSGTFFFSRPLYTDQSYTPAFLEFGILRSNGKLWVERFDNR